MPWIGALGVGGSLPLWMTVPHPAAVGSYGSAAVGWARDALGVELRWFQRLALVRMLEHDAAGGLVWRSVILSTPRRSGKSVFLRVLALWRVVHAELFGEQQLVVFTGKDLPICKEIHRKSWAWADSQGWNIRKQNGNEEIENPFDGSRWVVRGRDSVYGYDTTLGLVDEAFGVGVGVVDDGLEPSLLGRSSPQLLLTSTAHRRATPLMLVRRATALEELESPSDVLLLQWGAAVGADPADPGVWEAASPFWDADRSRMLGQVWKRVSQGRQSVDPDEPDPLEAWKAQYLNIWQEPVTAQVGGWPFGFDGCWRVVGGPPSGGLVAVEVSADRSVYGWVAAAVEGRGVGLWSGSCGSLEELLGVLGGLGPVQVVCGISLKDQLVGDWVVHPVGVSETRVATPVFADMVRRGRVGHDHGAVLLREFSGARTALTEHGEVLSAKRSLGPVAVLKAAVWAAWVLEFDVFPQDAAVIW